MQSSSVTQTESESTTLHSNGQLLPHKQSFLKILETHLKPKRNKEIQDGYGKEHPSDDTEQRGGLELGAKLSFGKHIIHPIYVSIINHCKAKQIGNQKASETSVEGRAITPNSSLNNKSDFSYGTPSSYHCYAQHAKIKFLMPHRWLQFLR